MGSLINTSLQIYLRNWRWKRFENRPRVNRVTAVSMVSQRTNWTELNWPAPSWPSYMTRHRLRRWLAAVRELEFSSSAVNNPLWSFRVLLSSVYHPGLKSYPRYTTLYCQCFSRQTAYFLTDSVEKSTMFIWRITVQVTSMQYISGISIRWFIILPLIGQQNYAVLLTYQSQRTGFPYFTYCVLMLILILY